MNLAKFNNANVLKSSLSLMSSVMSMSSSMSSVMSMSMSSFVAVGVGYC